MTDEKIQEVLISRRIFPIIGRIENGLINKMEKALFHMWAEDSIKVAHLLVDSGGGDVPAAISAYDLIKSLSFPVECTVVGDCHSSMLTLMAACTKRKATKHSRFLFHAMGYSPDFKSTEDIAEQMKVKLEQHKVLFEQVLKLQSTAYNITKEELLKMRESGERYGVKLTAEEAQQKGIIHEIVEKFDFLKI